MEIERKLEHVIIRSPPSLLPAPPPKTHPLKGGPVVGLMGAGTGDVTGTRLGAGVAVSIGTCVGSSVGGEGRGVVSMGACVGSVVGGDCGSGGSMAG